MSESYDNFDGESGADDDIGYLTDDGALEFDDGRYIPEDRFNELLDRVDAVENDEHLSDAATYEQLAAESQQEAEAEERLYKALDRDLSALEQELGYQLPDDIANEVANLALSMAGGGAPDVRRAYEQTYGKVPNLDDPVERRAEMTRRLDLLREEAG